MLVWLASPVHFCGCCPSSQIIVASVKGACLTLLRFIDNSMLQDRAEQIVLLMAPLTWSSHWFSLTLIVLFLNWFFAKSSPNYAFVDAS